MMITVDANYLYLLQISNALLLVIMFFSLARFESRCKTIEKFWESPTGSAVATASDSESSKQMRLTRQLEKRLGELQRSVKVMEIETKASKPRAPVERNLPIENALRMARLGASIDELTKNCGLNIGEAQLMKKLHGKANLVASGN